MTGHVPGAPAPWKPWPTISRTVLHRTLPRRPAGRAGGLAPELLATAAARRRPPALAASRPWPARPSGRDRRPNAGRAPPGLPAPGRVGGGSGPPVLVRKEKVRPPADEPARRRSWPPRCASQRRAPPAAARVHEVDAHHGQVLGAGGEHRDAGPGGAQDLGLAQQRAGDQPPHPAFQPLGGPPRPVRDHAGHGGEHPDLVQPGPGQRPQRRGRADPPVHLLAPVDDRGCIQPGIEQDATTASGSGTTGAPGRPQHPRRPVA